MLGIIIITYQYHPNRLNAPYVCYELVFDYSCEYDELDMRSAESPVMAFRFFFNFSFSEFVDGVGLLGERVINGYWGVS